MAAIRKLSWLSALVTALLVALVPSSGLAAKRPSAGMTLIYESLSTIAREQQLLLFRGLVT
jgi:hypothetical protein